MSKETRVSWGVAFGVGYGIVAVCAVLVAWLWVVLEVVVYLHNAYGLPAVIPFSIMVAGLVVSVLFKVMTE